MNTLKKLMFFSMSNYIDRHLTSFFIRQGRELLQMDSPSTRNVGVINIQKDLCQRGLPHS